MATELPPAEFAAAIGLKVDQLPALERAGLPFVTRKKGARVYPLPGAVRWYIEHALTTRTGNVPPRINQKDLAELVGYSPRQISNLVDDKKLTTIVEGGRRVYPLPLAVHEAMKHREELARGKTEEKLSAHDAAKLRKWEADAQSAELDLMERRGELIDRALAARAVGDLLAGLKAQLVQFTPRYEADLVGLDTRLKVREVLKPAINQEILRLSAAAAQVGRRIQMIDATNEDDESSLEEAPDADDAS